ncbi:Kef-type K+ transport system, membrane component [Halalkaliarchaeum desulfuricum]|uniref:Kef-type K+ transport system, membrane component n=1 Tax=Halalkaliarchaeum desulfuricum TaxID=2055893 RepID=A0A343TFR3_9EURY|nr:cation:proton antiporter [Halalkaliarchaeum desulfuricum]AUX07935.1 Kef-type K+ transport system, membrane component [Halalkaliarchaeum desulfuricum]
MSAEITLAADVGIIIVVAAIGSLVAKQTGQPTIVAYILAGLLLGPAALGIVEVGALTETMAELGLAFLLFLLGIKMRFEDIQHVLRPIVAISLPQMALVSTAGFLTAYGLGFTVWESVLIGLAVMYSSTAVVIKMLKDKDTATSLHGKIDVGVLLVQDIVVVIILAVLAAGRPDSAAEIALTLFTVLALVAGIGIAAVAASRYLLPVIFRRIAGNRDVFFLIAISWGFLFVLFAQEFDLSIEMGAFLAGLSIAQLPYSKELQDRINPLTDLFILVFFVSVGLQLDAADLFAFWEEAVLASIVLIPVKFLVFFALIDWQDFDVETTFLGSVNMIQVSEFGLVVGAVAVAGGFIGEPVLGFLTLTALLTMSVSVYVIKYNQQLYDLVSPFLERLDSADDRDVERKQYRNHAVVVGYDDVTEPALPLLAQYYDDVVVVDRKPDHIEKLEAAGFETLFGDISQQTIRKSAELPYADFVLSSSVQPAVNRMLLQEVAEETTVVVKAERVSDARDLYDLGADYVVLSTHVAGGRLAEFLEAYYQDRNRFEEMLQTDVQRLRTFVSSDSPSAFGGETDD